MVKTKFWRGFAVRLASSLAVGTLYDSRVQNWDLGLGARWAFSLMTTILYFSLGAHVILVNWASVCFIFQDASGERRARVFKLTAGCLCVHGFLLILTIIVEAELYAKLFAGNARHRWTDKLHENIAPALSLSDLGPGFALACYTFLLHPVLASTGPYDSAIFHVARPWPGLTPLARPDPLLVLGCSIAYTCMIAQGRAVLQTDLGPVERPATGDQEPLLPLLATGTTEGNDLAAVPHPGLQLIECMPILAVQVLAVTLAAGTCVSVTWVEWLSLACSLLHFIFLACYCSIGKAYLWGSSLFVGVQASLRGGRL